MLECIWDRHFEKICPSSERCRAAAVECLEDWLVAGISTGLLPGEWPLAHIEGPTDKRVWLHVLNAEAMVGGKGSYRTLDISHFHYDTMMMDPAQVAALTGSLDVEPQVEALH